MIPIRFRFVLSAPARLAPLMCAVLLGSMLSAPASAQSGFSIVPSEIERGGCYSMIVAGGNEAMVLNLQYSLNDGSVKTVYGWPALDVNGQALVCTDNSTPTGTYRFLYYSSNQNVSWQSTDATVTVNAPPPQPISLGFNPSVGSAGNDCYVMAVGNGSNMTVDLQYAFNGAWQPVWTTALNASGEWGYCMNHYDRVGRYDYFDMKNNMSSIWLQVYPNRPTTLTVNPPQPKWVTISPATIVQGQPYTMSVGNGAGVAFDLQYTLNGVPHTQLAWPTLPPSQVGSPDGLGAIQTYTASPATPLGKYVFTAIRNTLNTSWLPIDVPLSICPNQPPTITSLSPLSGTPGTSVTVSITGTNLCSAVLSATTAGLTFSNTVWNAPFTTVTATFNIPGSAAQGNTTIQLATPVNSTTASFSIMPSISLTKEYIRLGPRIIAAEAP